MARWKCPNKAHVKDHPEQILFEGDEIVLPEQKVAYMQVPKPAYCSLCNRYYTRDECEPVVA